MNLTRSKVIIWKIKFLFEKDPHEINFFRSSEIIRGSLLEKSMQVISAIISFELIKQGRIQINRVCVSDEALKKGLSIEVSRLLLPLFSKIFITLDDPPSNDFLLNRPPPFEIVFSSKSFLALSH